MLNKKLKTNKLMNQLWLFFLGARRIWLTLFVDV